MPSIRVKDKKEAKKCFKIIENISLQKNIFMAKKCFLSKDRPIGYILLKHQMIVTRCLAYYVHRGTFTLGNIL